MGDVKAELSSYSEELPEGSQQVKAADALKRIEEWNLFSAPIIVCIWKPDISVLFRIIYFVISFVPDMV